MKPATRVALIGFTRFEREHLQAGLRSRDDAGQAVLVPSRELAASSLAVVNADDAAAVAEILSQGRLASTVMLGTTPRPGAAAQLSRPISLGALLRALDEILRTAPPMSAAVQRVRDDWARLNASLGRAASLDAPAPPPAATPPPPPSPAAPAPAAKEHILVVDDNDVALSFMARHLQTLGFEVHLVRSGAEALQRVSRQHFSHVFLATGLDGLDGFHVCKTLKRIPYPERRSPPAVVLLLGHDAAVHKLRAEMAGADAVLSKPLGVQALRELMVERRLRQPAEAATPRAACSLWI